MAEPEARGIDYILGARGRATKEIRGVIADPARLAPLSIPKAADRGNTDLLVKEVSRSGFDAAGRPWRRLYIVCRNEAEAQRDAAERAAIVAGLAEALARGNMSLASNCFCRRFLDLKAGRRFEIDPRHVACSTASTCCAPTPSSPRSRPSCAIATAGWSRASSAPQNRCSPPG